MAENQNVATIKLTQHSTKLYYLQKLILHKSRDVLDFNCQNLPRVKFTCSNVTGCF